MPDTDTMTVTVRALATRDLGRRNAARVVLREVVVGLVNGLAVALLVGVGAAMWFANPQLGAVIGSALLFNMLVAGLAGVAIPIGLNALRIDPAVASGVFVTTVTDVVGFCAFLGLAAWWFGEDQGRYLVSVPDVEAFQAQLAKGTRDADTASSGVRRLGTVGGDTLFGVKLTDLRAAHESFFHHWMES